MNPCRLLVYRRIANLPSETFVREQFKHLTGARIHYDFDASRVGPSQTVLKLAQGGVYSTGHLPSRLGRLVDSFQPEAALIHFGTNAVAAGPGLRRRGVPTFPIFHGHDATVSKRFGVYSDRRICEEIERSAVTFCVSNFIKQRLIDRGAPAEKLEVHYTGIPLGPAPHRSELLDRRTGILFVGRLVEKKGAGDLIRAYAQLPSTVKGRHTLTIAGDGPQSGPLKELARELAADVSFLGSVGNDRVRAMMQEIRAVAMPSKTAPNGDAEGLGHVALEAQAAHCPVVGYKSGGLVEGVLNDKTGILVREGDVAALTEAIKVILCDDDAWRKLSVAGSGFVHTKFNLATNTILLHKRICEAIT